MGVVHDRNNNVALQIIAHGMGSYRTKKSAYNAIAFIFNCLL